MSLTENRAAQRLSWTREVMHDPDVTLEVASADASFRSYWRTRHGQTARIIMDAPPEHEDIRPWLNIGQRLAEAGLHTPHVYASDVQAGFALLEDLGSTHYLDALDASRADTLYGDALDTLLRMQRHVVGSDLPPYDEAFLTTEMELLPTWLLEHHLGLTLTCGQWDVLELAFRHILDTIAAQPKVFVHRDFHSRNLLLAKCNNPAIIDFQGALYGPLTYDVASLLRDCYIVWPEERVAGWLESYRQRLLAAELIDTSVNPDRFTRWFDLTGLQRHIKVLGLFCRLYYRDGKASYLNDLPTVLAYVLDVASRHEALGAFVALLREATRGRDLTRPRTP
ncbi:phosphotransferase [Oleiagrimonas sp. C23AA]|uniref:aminoglycoside phosphotransferase family protein n=1 Tax=Oleiagrimonas sp. C23AA TaxID=2719047 RepID=UPI001423A12B|nr:phosphotransferase [Oleiagrimonas sp. C23AA]NII11510.1 phosphotransferase [Oleiagrimonas sp. C23AA]